MSLETKYRAKPARVIEFNKYIFVSISKLTGFFLTEAFRNEHIQPPNMYAAYSMQYVFCDHRALVLRVFDSDIR